MKKIDKCQRCGRITECIVGGITYYSELGTPIPTIYCPECNMKESTAALMGKYAPDDVLEALEELNFRRDGAVTMEEFMDRVLDDFPDIREKR